MPGYKKIKKYFGNDFAGNEGVKREVLRDYVSKNPKKLFLLNRLIHPLVFKEVNKKVVQLKRLSEGKNPLLVCIESVYFDDKRLGKFVDQFVFVDAPDKKILNRLKKRKVPKNHLQALLDFQRKNFKEKGTYINNNGSLRDFHRSVVKLLRTYGYS
jgi:dephospho-CoA kinase